MKLSNIDLIGAGVFCLINLEYDIHKKDMITNVEATHFVVLLSFIKISESFGRMLLFALFLNALLNDERNCKCATGSETKQNNSKCKHNFV